MKKIVLLLAAMLLATPALAQITPTLEIGQPAPDFTAKTATGHSFSLSEIGKRPIVLEWTNPECPFVIKHYSSGNMQKLQKAATAEGAVWLTIFSSAPGKQGALSGDEAQAWMKQQGGAPTHILMDPEGTIGRLYRAKTTPHMFVIDTADKLVYDGAIDSKPTPDLADVDTAKNYVIDALADISAKRETRTPMTKPYGCGIKYDVTPVAPAVTAAPAVVAPVIPTPAIPAAPTAAAQ